MSHFFPLCRLNVQRSNTNHALTATNPKEEKVVNIVVIAEVTGC